MPALRRIVRLATRAIRLRKSVHVQVRPVAHTVRALHTHIRTSALYPKQYRVAGQLSRATTTRPQLFAPYVACFPGSALLQKKHFSSSSGSTSDTGTSPVVRDALSRRDADNFSELSSVFLPKIEAFIRSGSDSSTPLVNYALPDEINSGLLPVKESGYTLDEISAQVDHILDYSVRNNKSTFMDKMHSGSDSMGQFSSLLLSVINANAMIYAAAPSLICIENYMVRYLCDTFFGSQSCESNGGVFTPDGSHANTLAIKLARDKYFPRVGAEGAAGFGSARPLIVSNEQVHLSTMLAANSLGVGTDQVVKIPSKANGTIDVQACDEILGKLVKEGGRPFFMNSLAGTNVYGAFEDFEGLRRICTKYDMWMHVDAAWGGAAAFLKQKQGVDGVEAEIREHCEMLMKGSQSADSFVFDAHKFLSVPYYCSMLLVRDDEYLYKSCLKPTTNYQFHNSGKNSSNYSKRYDISMKTLQCARVPDAVKMYMCLLYYGQSGFESRVLNGMKNARYMQEVINESQDFVLVNNPAHFANVCFYYVPKSYRNEVMEWEANGFEKNVQEVDGGRLYSLLDSIPNKINLELRKNKDAASLLDYSGNIAMNLPSMFRGITSNHRMTEESIDKVLNDVRKAAQKLNL